MLFLLLLSLSLLVVIDGPLRFGLTRLHLLFWTRKCGLRSRSHCTPRRIYHAL